MPGRGPLEHEQFSGIPEPLRALNILESISEAVSAFDREWRFIYANHAAVVMSRQSAEDLLGACFWKLFPALEGTHAEASLRRTMEQRVQTRFEQYYAPFDLWVETDAYPTAGGIAIFVRDITVRKKADVEKDALYAALTLNEERFRVALKDSPIVVFNQDRNLVYTWVYNPLGDYRDIDWVGRNDDHLGAAGEALRMVKRSVIESGVGIQRELAIETNGEIRHWDFHLEPLRDPDGKVIGLTGAAADITRRRRNEAQIERQQDQLRAIIDGMPGLVSFVDREYRYRFVNIRYSEWQKLPLDRIEGRLVSEILRPDAFRELFPHLQRAMHGEATSFEARFEYADAVRDIRASYVPQCTRGEVEGVVVLVQDISDQKQAERARLETESQFRRIVQIASEGIWIVDTKGRTTFANQRMADLLGRTVEEMMGTHFTDHVHPEDVQRAREGFAHRMQGDTSPREYRGVRRDGEIIWMDFTATPVRDNEGNTTGVLAMCTDVTERIRAREQLQQAQKLESLGILAGGIAHDFNNLLVGILGNASLAQEMLSPSSPVRSPVDQVISAAESAAQLTHQMLAYSGKGRFLLGLVDLSKTVAELLPLISRPLPKNVEIRTALAPDLPLVEADRSQLQQVIMNLIVNGAEACGDAPGTVTIATSRVLLTPGSVAPTFGLAPIQQGEFVRLEVKDTGSGMDDQTKARIFDPFFTTKFTGRGLGLSAVLGIIRAHKGALEVDSQPGGGTIFRVFFPCSERRPEPDSDVKLKPAPASGNGTVLVVDDELLVLRMVRPALERAGFRVLLAEDGASAVRLLSQNAGQISAVLLDLTMPRMDGEATLTALRNMAPDLRIVLSTGFDETEVAERFHGKGLAGFLHKPYTSARLVETMRSVCGTQETEA